MPWQDVHGLFLLNKPTGITSNRALQTVRKIFNAAKAGHTGSLDPIATGLLPCCFGDATKIAGLMLNSDKEYIAEFLIGNETDTGDRTGTTTQESGRKVITEEALNQAIQSLIGPIQQIPPMYSALHHNGKRLYQLAREGVEVERKPRNVIVHELELLSHKIKDRQQIVSIRAKVSKGTYIRTLIEDLAKKCGTLAHMTKLHRTSLGVLTNKMIDLEELQNSNNPMDFLETMDIALIEYPKINLPQDDLTQLTHGKRIDTTLEPKVYRIYDAQEIFVGLGEALENGQFKVKKLFLKSYLSRNDLN